MYVVLVRDWETEHVELLGPFVSKQRAELVMQDDAYEDDETQLHELNSYSEVNE